MRRFSPYANRVDRRRKQDRAAGARRFGVAAVEFAIVSPVFFILIMGMMELGRALMVQQVLTNASREAARTAVVGTATSSSVQSAATSYAANAKVNGTTASVTPDPASAAPGTSLTVTVSVPYGNVTWVPLPKYLQGATLTAKTTMRKEGFQ